MRSFASRTRRALASEPSPSLSRPSARLSTSLMNGSHSARRAHPALLAVSMAEERAAAERAAVAERAAAEREAVKASVGALGAAAGKAVLTSLFGESKDEREAREKKEANDAKAKQER